MGYFDTVLEVKDSLEAIAFKIPTLIDLIKKVQPFFDARMAVVNGTHRDASRRRCSGFQPETNGQASPEAAWSSPRPCVLSSRPARSADRPA